MVSPEDESEHWVMITTHQEASKGQNAISSPPSESLEDRIIRVSQDLRSLRHFYTISSSPTTYDRLEEFYADELESLEQICFTDLCLDGRADYLLLKNWLTRERKNLKHSRERDATFAEYVEPFASQVRQWIEKRMRIEKLDPQEVAGSFTSILNDIHDCKALVEKNAKKYSKASGYRAAKVVRELRSLLEEVNSFYSSTLR